ncbi:Asx homology domain-containing protein [Thamnidium elegans]|nr:Asx homology domain-containing protein [Thamnidium elegans]
MFNSSQHSMLLSPIGKRRELEQDDISLETSQLMIRSPTNGVGGSNHKKARYEPSWTLDNLCTHPCSPLAAIDLESIFSLSNFHLLSQEKREELYQMLPEKDQPSYLSHDIESHSYVNSNNNVFSKSENPILWNTLSDWQTMLGQGEYHHHHRRHQDFPPSPSPPTNSSSNKSTSTTSTHHLYSQQPKSKCPSKKDKFKDEAFESYWGELIDKERAHNVAGDSKNITLKDMCRKGLIREGDVIVYKRNFSACKVVVSKSMTVVKASGLSGISIKLDDEIFEDFETPTALETKILDHHGKVTKDKRPNGNAFKSIRLIRAGKDMGRLFDIRKDGFGEQSGY